MEITSEAVMGFFIAVYGAYSGWQILKTKIHIPISRKIDFMDHSFFNIMENALAYNIPSIMLEDEPEKADITRIYATEKIRIFKEEFEFVVKEFKRGKGKHCFTETEILKIVQKTIKKYRTSARKEIARKYNKKIAETFDNKFTNEVHYACIQTMLGSISSICKCSFYKTCSEKLSAILDILGFAFQHTIIDLERTCSALNGQISKELVKLGYPDTHKEYVTKDEFEISEKMQNMMIKDLNKGKFK